MSLTVNVAYGADFSAYVAAATRNTIPFNLQNSTDDLLQLAIFDYEKWATAESEDGEEELFSIDNVKSAQGYLTMARNNLYLVQAYFEDGGNIDIIIQKSDRSEGIRLEIVEDYRGKAFVHNDSYEVLNIYDAARLLKAIGN
jgi:hypothetical protein